LSDENGTCLEGEVAPSDNPAFPDYNVRRDIGYYFPWPEWVQPPIVMKKVNGVFIFNCMLSWWSRYIGISPYFEKPIRMEIKNCPITKIDGGFEADALSRFLFSMKERVGDVVYGFNTLHFGVHPQAYVEEHQCTNLLYRRLIEHSQNCNIHVHIGAPSDGEPNPSYPYSTHITGDVRHATFVVGNITVHDRGHLTALDDPMYLPSRRNILGAQD
jgi:hypothetical protein